MTDHLSPAALEALKACLVSRGARKGMLKASAPPLFGPQGQPLAYAAWMGAMLSINPYKASIGGMIFMKAEQKAIANEVTAFFDAHPELRHLDRDRSMLEHLGVW